MSMEKSQLRSVSPTYGGTEVTVTYEPNGGHPDPLVENVAIREEALVSEENFCGVSFHDIVYVVNTGCCGTKPKEILHSVR